MFEIGELHRNLSEVVAIQIPKLQIESTEGEMMTKEKGIKTNIEHIRKKTRKEKMKLFNHVGNSSSPAV